MQKFRKKPIVIEAIRLLPATFSECIKFIGGDKLGDGTSLGECCITISTLEGEMDAYEGDWIIKGVKGEFYPCKANIFEATYEKVD